MSCRDWRANKTNKRLFPFPCWTVCPNQGVRFKGRAWERAERVAGCAAHPPCARRTRRERSGGLGLPGQRPAPRARGCPSCRHRSGASSGPEASVPDSMRSAWQLAAAAPLRPRPLRSRRDPPFPGRPSAASPSLPLPGRL